MNNPIDAEALKVAIEAAQQTVTFSDALTDKAIRAAEIEHDRQYARTLISTYLDALPPTDGYARGVEAARENLRQIMLAQPISDHGRETYSDGLVQGLALAISHIDAATPSRALSPAVGMGEADPVDQLIANLDALAQMVGSRFIPDPEKVERYRAALLAPIQARDEDRSFAASIEAQAKEIVAKYLTRCSLLPCDAEALKADIISALSKRAGEREGDAEYLRRAQDCMTFDPDTTIGKRPDKETA